MAIFSLVASGVAILTSLLVAIIDGKIKKKRPPEVIETEKEYKGIKKFLKTSLREERSLKKAAKNDYCFMKVLCKENDVFMEEIDGAELK